MGKNASAPSSTDRPTQCLELPLDAIIPDPHNRTIDETFETFQAMVDSVRLFGVINRIHVRQTEQGGHELIDGEKRWRAARAAGRPTVPAEVWPTDTNVGDLLARGLISNEQRDAHGAVQIARRLRDLKLQHGLPQDQLAGRVCMPEARVAQYSTLFNGSEDLLEFFERDAITLSLAVEFVKYERATNEIAARKLVARHRKEPLSVAQLAELRRRLRSGGDARLATVDAPKPERRPTFVRQVEAAFRGDAAAARAALEAVLGPLGYRLVPLGAAAKERSE